MRDRHSNGRPAARIPGDPLTKASSGQRRGATLVIAVGLLISIKLVLVSALPIQAATQAIHDDALFVRLGSLIAAGQWLGPYDQTTLIKGPGYPLFIALCHRAGVPLKLCEHLLYIAFCLLLLIAVRPAIESAKVRLVLFAVLLFNPVTVDQWMNRTLREGIYPAQTGLVLTCLFGAALQWQARTRQLLPWMVGLGMSLAWFWVTREEGLWIIPAVAFVFCAIARLAWRTGRGWRWLAACVVPLAILAAGVNVVCIMNWRNYGVYEVVETKSPEFLAAYGALCRIRHNEFNPLVPAPQYVREEIYAVSPAFCELRTSLEGPVGRLWAALSATELPGLHGETAAGWFPFTLRDAVAKAGHARNAADARDFYTRLAREVNQACDVGSLPSSGARRDTLAPPWDRKYLPLLMHSAWVSTKSLVRFESVDIDVLPSTGDQAALAFYRDMTRGTLSPTELADAQVPESEQPAGSGDLRMQALELLGVFYQLAVPFAMALAMASLLAQLAALGSGRRSPMLLLELATLLAIGGRLATVAFLDAAYFPAINTRYLAPAYPLVLLFCILAIAGIPTRKANR